MLAQARATGLSVEGTLRAFLGRYAPPMCSSLIDMTVPDANLKVDLVIEHPIALGDADASTQEGAADALNHALRSQSKGSVPHINRAFVVDRKPVSLSIDYVPDHRAHCVEPPDMNF